MARKNSSGDEAIIGFVTLMLMVLFALPFAGIYLLGSEDSNKKASGALLIIIAIIIFVAMAAV